MVGADRSRVLEKPGQHPGAVGELRVVERDAGPAADRPRQNLLHRVRQDHATLAFRGRAQALAQGAGQPPFQVADALLAHALHEQGLAVTVCRPASPCTPPRPKSVALRRSGAAPRPLNRSSR